MAEIIYRKYKMKSAETFSYVLQCLAFGSGYFAKVIVKKAMSEASAVELTGAEKFWYVLQCLAFGSGYFAKVIVKKAMSEVGPQRQARRRVFGTSFSALHLGLDIFQRLFQRRQLARSRFSVEESSLAARVTSAHITALKGY